MERCKSCGAPLPESGKCEYCGAEHNRIRNVDDVYYKINFCGLEHVCYIDSVKTDILYSSDAERDVDGRMHKAHIIRKLRFVLVEV